MAIEFIFQGHQFVELLGEAACKIVKNPDEKGVLRLFELARVLVRFDQITGGIVNAKQRVI